MLMAALFALALFAPAAMAQDDDADDGGDDGGAVPSVSASATQDDDDDDDGSVSASVSASASASATATATAATDDDDDALPETGGPALLAPVAGALLMAGGVASVLALRRGR